MNIELDHHQIGYLLGQVRMDLREHLKAIRRMQSKFGPHYDAAPHDAKTAFIEEVYRTLGGDPERIREHGGRS